MSVSYGKQLSGIRTESAAPPASQVKQQRHHYHRHRTTAKKAEVLSNHRTSQRARRGEVSGNRRLTCEVSVPSRRRMMPGLIIFALRLLPRRINICREHGANGCDTPRRSCLLLAFGRPKMKNEGPSGPSVVISLPGRFVKSSERARAGQQAMVGSIYVGNPKPSWI